MVKSKFFRNIVTGFGGQFIIIILGIIVPRIMISSYGSDINGLVSTLSQIFSYVALLEAGIGQSAKNALYKPIAEQDKSEISCIYTTAQAYFRKITFYYGIGVILIAVAAPFVLKTDVNHITVFLLTLLEGASGVISFFYVETPVIMLNADGRGYINNVINLISRVLCYIVKIVLACIGMDIVLVQLIYFIITLTKVLFYKGYFKKYYMWIDGNATQNYLLLKDRNSYLVTEAAWTIFSSTDMIVLSIFVSTQLSSVYSVYSLIFSNIHILLNSVASSINYVLGRTYHENLEKYIKVHDALTTAYLGSMTILMSICYMLCIPFVRLYTAGVTDINYVYQQLPLLFCVVQLLSWSRNVSGNLTGIAGYAKTTSYISLVEAITNVVLSVIFVQKFGIVGVLAATALALPLKVIWCIYISDKRILNRSYKNTFLILGANYGFFLLVVTISHWFKPQIVSLLEFVVWGSILAVLIGTSGIIVNLLANKEFLQIVKTYVIKPKG